MLNNKNYLNMKQKVFIGTVSKTETLLTGEKTVFYAVYLQSLSINTNHLGENSVNMQCAVKMVDKEKRDLIKPTDVINGGYQNDNKGIDVKMQSVSFNIPLKEIPVCDFSGQNFKNADEQETFKNDHYLLSYLNKEVLLGQKKWEELS